jgi:parvulin-like peptidyl-prolyl isomerase
VVQRFSSKLDLPDPGRPRFPWRIGIYSIVLGYLVVDLFIFHGPLRRRLDASTPGSPAAHSAARKQQWVARVNGTPITASQLNRAVEVSNYKRGVNSANFTPKNLKINRIAALGELIDDQTVASYARNYPAPVSEEKIDAELARFKKQFRDDDELLLHLQEQNIDPAQLRDHIAGHVRQIAYLENRVAPSIIVADDEARAWFDQNKDSTAIPELVRARHIFLSDVENDSPHAEAVINEIHRQLSAGEKSFTELAQEFSDDIRTRDLGGDLSYFSRQRLPEDFTTPVFNLKVDELSRPFRTSLGWHIAQVTDRKPARDTSFDEVRPEIIALLESRKREIIMDRVLDSMKTGSIIEYFPENLFPVSALPPAPENP